MQQAAGPGSVQKKESLFFEIFSYFWSNFRFLTYRRKFSRPETCTEMLGVGQGAVFEDFFVVLKFIDVVVVTLGIE